MRLLVLGATGLSGTAITRAALERGHRVIAVHRGGSDTLGPLAGHPRLEQVLHDRSDGHRPLQAHGPYDAVVDVSARIPAWVADAVRTLDDDEPWWVQLSSGSVYADGSRRGPRETDQTATFTDPVLELRVCTDPKVEFSYRWYAPAKAACERLLTEAAGRARRTTILRPVLITGAHDWTWRAPRWLVRVERGPGVVTLAPPADDPVQVVDARDLAAAALDAIEERIVGTYNVAPAPGTQTVGSLLAAAGSVLREHGIEPSPVQHAPLELLREHGVEEWSDLPAWLTAEDLALVTVDTSLYEEVFAPEPRALADTYAHVYEWTRQPGVEPKPDPLDRERELAALAALGATRPGA